MDVVKRIKDLIDERGWTIYQLTVEADIGQSTLSNMFSRGTMPSVATLLKICDALGISVSQFFDDVSEKDVTLREKELLKHFRKLPKSKQEHLIGLIK